MTPTIRLATDLIAFRPVYRKNESNEWGIAWCRGVGLFTKRRSSPDFHAILRPVLKLVKQLVASGDVKLPV
jgi:hypothetical protein